jgi:ATP-dependent exoDNAse (exonuclease V) alpha subunit
MAINKSQGQSLQIVGVDLRTAVFSHGQLYVALSRVTDVRRLTVLNGPERGRHVQNVVYSEVLESRQQLPATGVSFALNGLQCLPLFLV